MQGVLGALGLLSHENSVVTVLHVLGSALVWTGAVRVFLDTRGGSRVAERGLPEVIKVRGEPARRVGWSRENDGGVRSRGGGG